MNLYYRQRCFGFKYDLDRSMYYTPQVQHHQGSNSNHDSTFHATKTPAQPTCSSVTDGNWQRWMNCTQNHYQWICYRQRYPGVQCKETGRSMDGWLQKAFLQEETRPNSKWLRIMFFVCSITQMEMMCCLHLSNDQISLTCGPTMTKKSIKIS